MRSKPLIIVLILVCPTISACGGSLVAPVSAPQNLGLTHDAALASETERPFAYVAETCRRPCPALAERLRTDARSSGDYGGR